MSLVAPEARDCFQEGPGLPPKWPYRLMSDDSDVSKLGEGSPSFNGAFSMTGGVAIADIVLTGRHLGGKDLFLTAAVGPILRSVGLVLHFQKLPADRKEYL
jgi:hypothetical protein